MAHKTTKSAMEALAAEEQAFWAEGKQYFHPYRESGSLGEADWYNTHTANIAPERWQQVLPYAYEIMGKPFHNFPVEQETAEGTGAWQTSTEKNWRWAMQGFDYYVTSVTRCLKAGRLKDACGFLGWLCHVFQDGCGFLHALEGPAGVQPMVFTELLPPPPSRQLLSPVSFLGEGCPPVDIRAYEPILLGTSVPEATFHLYHRYRQANRHSRQRLIPLVQSSYAGDEAGEAEIRTSICKKIAELLADIFHTVYCLAQERFQAEEASRLDCVDMAELFPIEYPNHLGGYYGMTPIVKGFCLDSGRNTVPLALFLAEAGGTRRVTFERGLGTGAHYEYVLSYGIPRGVYQRVELATGLHAELGRNGHITVNIKLDESILFRKEFVGSAEGERITADISRGGILRWIVQGMTEFHDPNNQVVWAEPVLRKAGGAE